MSSHLVGFYENLASATLNALTAVVDDILNRPQADRFQVPPDFNSIHWGSTLGATLARGQIVAPSLEEKRASQEVIPHERGAIVHTLDSAKIFIPPKPVVLTPSENVSLQAANSAAGADPVYGLLSFKAPGPLPEMPAGDIIVVRATSATALVANTWTTCALTLDKELKAGTYSLVGMIAVSATGIGARAIMVGQNYRPGVPVMPGTEATGRAFDMSALRGVQFYHMGSFDHIAIPQVQFLASAGDTAEYISLYLIKTA